MKPIHHPPTELLWSYVVGNADAASSLLVATHLALCPHCRRETVAMEAAAGEMFEAIETAPVEDRAFDRIMARIDAPPPASQGRGPNMKSINPIYPRPLRDHLLDGEPQSWRWIAEGVEAADINLEVTGRRVRLIRVEPGRRFPRHGHGGDELTLVLAGRYRSESGAFARGDVETADQTVVHQPVADSGAHCICLTVTRGALLPGLLRSLMSSDFGRRWFGARS